MAKKKTTRSLKQINFAAVLEKSDNKLWGAHFRVPRYVAKVFGKDRRVVCTLNEKHERQCAIVPHGKGAFVITVNKSLRTSLGLDFGEEISVSLTKDQSAFGLPLPEELQELLRQDKEGNSFFEVLTPGRKRTLLHIVGSVKNTDKRLGRAIAIVQHLKTTNGKINYKELYRMLKDPRPHVKQKSPD